MKKERHIVMCVGLTHSGKTTFAKKLIKEHPNAVLIDNDEIATFVNTKYPSAAFSEYNNIKRNFKEPNLKFLLFRDLLEFSMKCEVPIVLSNGNLGNDIRTLVSKLAKKYSYKLIVVYFNLSKDVIIERIAKTTKSTSSFLRSKNWTEVFKKQEGYAELPPSKNRTSHFFEIIQPSDTKKVLKDLNKLLL